MKQSQLGSKSIINEEMGNTSETHKDKVTGVNDDGVVGDVDLKVHEGDEDVSLIPFSSADN